MHIDVVFGLSHVNEHKFLPQLRLDIVALPELSAIHKIRSVTKIFRCRFYFGQTPLP